MRRTALLLLALWLAAPAALAGDRDEAADLNEEGIRLTKAGEYEKAIEEFLTWYEDIDKFHADCKDWIKKIHDNLEIPDPNQRWRTFRDASSG